MRRDPFRFLDAAALGCLGSCGFFVDAWGLRLVLAQCFHPSGGFLRWVVVSFGVLWGLSFCLLPRGGHFPDRRSCFRCSGVGLVFSGGALFACGICGLGPLSVGPLLREFLLLAVASLFGP